MAYDDENDTDTVTDTDTDTGDVQLASNDVASQPSDDWQPYTPPQQAPEVAAKPADDWEPYTPPQQPAETAAKPADDWEAYNPPQDPRGLAERITEGWKGGFGEEPLGMSAETQKNYPLWRGFQPLVAGVDATLRAVPGLAGAAAGWGAGMLERNPEAMLPYGINRAEADRLQRDLTIIGQGAMIEPAMGPAAAHPLPADQALAKRARLDAQQGARPAAPAAPEAQPVQEQLPFGQSPPYNPKVGAPQEAQIGGGEQQPRLPFEQPAPPPARPQPELPLEPPPVNADGQYGFNIEQPHGVGVPRTTYENGKWVTEPARTSRSAMPDAGGVAKEAAPPASLPPEVSGPPPAPGTPGSIAANVGAMERAVQERQNQSTQPGQARPAPPPEDPWGWNAPMRSPRNPNEAQGSRGSGINVVQPGQVEPTLGAAVKVATAEPPAAPPRTTFEPPRQPDGTYPPPRPAPLPPDRSLVPRVPETTQGVTEPPVPAGHTRMYQGEQHPENVFTTDRAAAERAGPVKAVDVHNERGMPFFNPTNEPNTFTTRNEIYRQRAQPVERIATEPVGERPTAKAAEEPGGVKVAQPDLEEKVAKAAPPQAAPQPEAAAPPKSREAIWRVKGEDRPVRVSPIPAKQEGYTRITYKGKDQAVPNGQLREKTGEPLAAAAAKAAEPKTIQIGRRPEDRVRIIGEPITFNEALLKHGTWKGLLGQLTPFIRKVVSDRIGNMPVYVVSKSELDKFGEGRNIAYYNSQQDHIVINAAHLKNPQNMAHSILHEGIHAVTAHAISANPNIAALFNALRVDVRKMLPKNLEPYLRRGFIDNHEFAAEAFSNKIFQDMLAKHELSPKLAKAFQDNFGATAPIKSAWDGIVQTVRQILGVPPNKMTALEAVMRTTEHAMGLNEPAKATMMAARGVKTQDYSIHGLPAGKGEVVARDKFGNEAKFSGDTVHAAAAYAKGAGYRPEQIFHTDGSPYVPPKAAATVGATPGAGASASAKTASAKAAGAQSAPPPGSKTPPPPLGGQPIAAGPKQLQSFRDGVNKLVDTYKRTFDPARISEQALQGQAPARESRAFFEGEKTRIIRAGAEAEKMWKGVPEAERLKAIDDYENGRKIDPKYQKYFDERFGPEMKRAHKEEVQEGSKANYIEDYVAHEWNRPKPGQPSISEHFKSMGPTWFQKARTIDFINEGYKAGYTLKNTNPESILRSRLIAGADMRSKARLLNDWRGMGLATKSENTNIDTSALRKAGWQELNGPDRAKWLIAPDVQTIWKNGIEAKGLWQSESIGGDIFRGWMAFKAAWVPLRLAASAFHALHVAHINMNTNLARAVGQFGRGDTAGAYKSLGQAFEVKSQKGIMGREQWALPEYMRSQEGKEAVRMMEEGGFVPMMNEELQTTAKRDFQKAMENKNIFTTPLHGMRYAIQKLQAPLFEHWIPHLKTAAYLNDAADLLKRRPDLLADPVMRKVALTEVAKSIDNRFGEMFYGGLFWNRYAKDVSIGSFLSLGWNLGFAREFLGAGIETVSRPAGKYIPGLEPSATKKVALDATNKMTFASLYMGTAAVIGGAMTWMLTGKPPEDINDYIFPRVGGINPDGSPRRLTTMFYTREIPMLMKHVQEHGGGIGGIFAGGKDMVWNKMLLEPFMELYNNRSYFGKEIYDTNAPGYQQLYEAGKHIIGDQFSPMAVSGAKRAIDTGGDPMKEVPLAFLGFGPAPKYAEASAMQNRIGALYREHVAPGARAYEDEAKTGAQQKARTDIMLAIQRKDDDALGNAITAGVEAGLTKNYIKDAIKGVYGDQKMFRQLPTSDQLHLLNSGTKDEVDRYFPYAKKETKIKWYERHPNE